jgi:uncharacterized protein involved in type VI secretion and phage assembly
MDEVLARLVEKVENRYYGKYRAFVVDNADPENRGRLKLRVPSVLGDDIVSGWALPCSPYGGAANQGFFFIPEVDAGVWVEFEAGNLDYPVWVGTYWAKPGGESEAPKPNGADGAEEGSVQDPPTRKIIKTLKGTTIQLEDAGGAEMLMLWEQTNENLVVLNSDGIKIKDGKGNTVTMDNSGVKVEDKNGNVITMESAGVTIKSTAINIGDQASEPLVMGNKLMSALSNWYTAFSTHTHIGNMGAPTSPPTPPVAPIDISMALSPTNKVK